MPNKKLSATPDEALYVLSMTQIQYYVDYIRKMDDEFKKDPKFYSLEKIRRATTNYWEYTLLPN